MDLLLHGSINVYLPNLVQHYDCWVKMSVLRYMYSIIQKLLFYPFELLNSCTDSLSIYFCFAFYTGFSRFL